MPSPAVLSSQTYGTSAKTITNATTNKRYCFSVKDQAGNTGYGGVNVNLAAPVISLTQDQNSVDATATMAGDPTVDTASWAHSDVLTSDPTCSEATYNTAGSSENTAPVDSGDDGDYICFKVANSLGVYSYAEWTIDFTAPTVTVAQSGSTLTASATDAGVGLGASPVFKHTAALNTTATCNSSQTYGTSAKTITNATTNKRYCFSVKDQAGNTGYGGVNVNLKAPVISLTQDQNSVDATATMAGDPTIDTASWAHSDVLTSDPTCSEATYNTAGSSENTAPVDSGDDGDYICFKVANSLGVYSYAEWTIDFTAPTVTVAQNGSTLTASATDAGVGLGASPVFKHTAALNTTATCNSSQTYGTSAKTITNATTNKRYCFSVKDQAGNTGYGGVNVNLTAPVISLTQDQNSVDATATMAGDPTIDTASWAHSDVLTSDPTCSEATYNTAGSSENTAPVDSGDDGDWVCFKVANSLGVYSYAEWTIDFTAPVVNVSQTGTTLTASSTATDLPATPVWQKSAALGSNPTSCSDSSISYSNGNIVSNAVSGKYYCFKVTDKQSNTGYGKATPDTTKPSLTLVQANDRIKLQSTAGLSDIKYFITGTDPDCDNNDDWDNAKSGSTTTAMDDNDWACFRGKNSNSVYGYADLQLLASKRTQTETASPVTPAVSLKQVNDTVVAAGDGILSWAWRVNPDNGCSQSTSFSDGQVGFESTVTGLAHDDRVCFRALGRSGLYGYAGLTVNLNQPALSFVQNQSRVLATAVAPDSTGLDYNSWANSGLLAAGTDCSTAGYNPAGAGQNSLAIGSDKPGQNGRTVCFMVKNSLEVAGYGHWTVDFTAPAVTVVQNNTSLIASSLATDLDPVNPWHYGPAGSDVDCDRLDLSAWRVGRTVDQTADGDWYCFRATDDKGNTGYGRLGVDLTKPVLTVVQKNNRVSLSSAGSFYNISHFTSGLEPDCDDSDTFDQTGDQTAVMDDDHWVCFRASNAVGVYNFAKLQINLTPVTVTVSQSNDQVQAQADGQPDSSSWANFMTDDDQPADCDTSGSFGQAGPGNQTVAVSRDQDRRWLCFMVVNNLGLTGYGQHQIDYTAPVLTISQNGNSLQVTSSDTDLADEAYYHSRGYDSQTDCSGLTGSDYSSGDTVTETEDGQYYCFRVDDQNGNSGYGFYQLPAPAPAAIASVTGPPAGSLTASIINGQLSLTSWAGLTNWQYVFIGSGQSCNGAAFSFGASAGTVVDLTVAPAASRLCFRAVDANGRFSYYQAAASNGWLYQPPAATATGLTPTVSSDLTGFSLNSQQQIVLLVLAGLTLTLAAGLQLLAGWRRPQAAASFYVRVKRQIKLTVKQHPALAAKIELVRQINRPLVNPTTLDKSINIQAVERDRIKLAVNTKNRSPERISISLTVRKEQ